MLTTPKKYISDINTQDRTICCRNGNIVTLTINIATLKQLTPYKPILTIPTECRPPRTIFCASLEGTGIRIGVDGTVMPCAQVDAKKYIRTVASYITK